MLIDAHVHTKRCHHAENDLEDYIKEAIKTCIKVIGFSEILPVIFCGSVQIYGFPLEKERERPVRIPG